MQRLVAECGRDVAGQTSRTSHCKGSHRSHRGCLDTLHATLARPNQTTLVRPDGRGVVCTCWLLKHPGFRSESHQGDLERNPGSITHRNLDRPVCCPDRGVIVPPRLFLRLILTSLTESVGTGYIGYDNYLVESLGGLYVVDGVGSKRVLNSVPAIEVDTESWGHRWSTGRQ